MSSVGSPWPTEFEEIVLAHLTDTETALQPQQSLRDRGLDSLASLGMLAALEGAYGVTFPDSRMNAKTFSTAENLWLALQLTLSEQDSPNV